MTAPDPRLDEIQARLSAATPGRWFANRYWVGAGDDESDPDTEIAKAAFTPDATFIANAPADVAFLLAELRKAHEALERVEESLRDLSFDYDVGTPAVVEVDAIRAAVAAAKGDERG